MLVQPYLFLDGRCEEAIEFYVKRARRQSRDAHALTRTVPNRRSPAWYRRGAENKVMHASLQDRRMTIMAVRRPLRGKPELPGLLVVADGRDEAAAKTLFAALGDGGQVRMPLREDVFLLGFGMVADRFGVTWMIIVMP